LGVVGGEEGGARVALVESVALSEACLRVFGGWVMGYLDAIPVYCSGVRFEVESRGDVLGSLRARALWSCKRPI